MLKRRGVVKTGKSKKLWFKANKNPVGVGRAMQIEEAHEGMEVDIVRVRGKAARMSIRKGRYGDTYDVYVRRKGK